MGREGYCNKFCRKMVQKRFLFVYYTTRFVLIKLLNCKKRAQFKELKMKLCIDIIQTAVFFKL